MPLPSHLFSAAFREQRLGLVLKAIVVIMVYLGTLALAAQVALGSSFATWEGNLENRLTIEIPAPENGQAPREDSTAHLADAVRAIPGVTKVETLPKSEVTRLLKPWIDDDALLNSLPVPALIDVELKGRQSLDIEDLSNKVSRLAPSARIHAHGAWMAQVVGLVRGLALVAGAVALLSGGALVVAMGLICRVAFASQHQTIDVLHIMGATDKDIAGQFRRRVARMSWPAALIGFVLAAATCVGLAFLFQLYGTSTTSLSVSWGALAGVAAVAPVTGIVASVLTAHFSVLRFLRRTA